MVKLEETVHLTLETPIENKRQCPDCGKPYLESIYYVHNDNTPYCVGRAESHEHNGEKEVFITLTFGTWVGGPPFDDHVTFSCRYGYMESQRAPAFTLIEEKRPEPILGKRLTRHEALKHPLLSVFWGMVDFLLLEDPKIDRFILGSYTKSGLQHLVDHLKP